ncbi:MAG: hypothetical protein P4L65_10590 [Legionella sp.]|nr:hypothetical protein [Legionella sp.]
MRIEGYLRLSKGRIEKTEILKKTLLGKWIAQTCTVTGFTDNTYKQTNNLSCQEIDTHLNYTPLDLKKIEQLGVNEFLWYTKRARFVGPSKGTQAEYYLKEKASTMLNLVINLHRATLRVSYIRKGLTVGVHLNGAFGETWLFSGDGKPLFEGLMSALDHAISNYEKALKELWELFYLQSYQPFAQEQHKDKTDIVYQDMMKASGFYGTSTASINKIYKLMSDIHNYKFQVLQSDESNNEKKYFLTMQLYDYLSRIEGYNPNNLSDLKSLMRNKTYCAGRRIYSNLGNQDAVGSESALCLSDTNAIYLESAKNAYKSAIMRLVEHGGYQAFEIPNELLEAFYQYTLISPNTSPDKLENCMKEYEKALETAKQHKLQQAESAHNPAHPFKITFESTQSAYKSAKMSLIEQGGYDESELPQILLEAFYQRALITSETPHSEARDLCIEKYNEALKIAQLHKLEQPSKNDPMRVQNAMKLAIINLMDMGGYDVSSLDDELVEAFFQYNLITAETPQDQKSAYIKKYDEAVETAKLNKKLQQQEEIEMPQPEELQALPLQVLPADDYIVPMSASIGVAIKLEGLFNKSTDVYSESFIPLSTIAPLHKKLASNFHRLIYETVLKPYDTIVTNRFVSFIYAYKEAQLKLLQNHYSRMVDALLEVVRTDNIYAPENKIALEVIDQCLLQGLIEISQAMSWIKIPHTVFTSVLPKKINMLESMPENRIKFLSPQVIIAEVTARNAALSAEKTALKAENTAAKAVITAAKAEITAANAENTALKAQLHETTATLDATKIEAATYKTAADEAFTNNILANKQLQQMAKSLQPLLQDKASKATSSKSAASSQGIFAHGATSGTESQAENNQSIAQGLPNG